MNKFFRVIILSLLAAGLLASLLATSACNGSSHTQPNDTTQNTQGDASDSSGDNTPGNNNGSSESATVVLTFNGLQVNPSVPASECGLTVEGNAFVITKGGSYELKGDLSNGQILVSVPKTEEVELILNNFTASCTTSAPLYIKSANKATIVLASGSVNSLSDASVYQFSSPTEDKPNACIYSEDDLTIKGKGTLTVTGNYNNGIGCKNDLRIKEGNITVSAPNNIVKGNDSVEIGEATLTLSGGEDAIKTSATDRTDKGYILILSGATVNITCVDDALQATVSVTVEAGATVTGTAGGSAINCDGTVNADATAMSGLQSAS